MNLKMVLHVLGTVFLVLALSLAVCALVGWLSGDSTDGIVALWVPSATATILGAAFRWTLRGNGSPTVRDGLGVVTGGWFVVGALGSIPYLWSGAIPDISGAVFETVSGLTTTGASVIASPESLPRGVLLWRSTTHFLGGMGVLLLCVAILPAMGAGGMQLYRAEVAGPFKDRVTPRIADTARLMWGLYVSLCVVLAILLRIGGMNWFDSVCHAFGTIATGGFSTRSRSIAAFDNLYIEIVVMVFMLIGAGNFVLHYRLIRTGDVRGYLKDSEFRFFIGLWAIVVSLVAFSLWRSGAASLGSAVRESLFAVTSLISTTGFSTADFSRWSAFARILLVGCMVVGGCVGSTAGGIKQLRIMVVVRSVFRRVRVFYQPRAVVSLKVGDTPMSDAAVGSILCFSMLYVILLFIGSAAMSLYTPDLMTAVTSVVATTGGVGPGLAAVGPSETYAFIPAPGKWVLVMFMMMGRLEFYTVFALLAPGFWRR